MCTVDAVVAASASPSGSALWLEMFTNASGFVTDLVLFHRNIIHNDNGGTRFQ